MAKKPNYEPEMHEVKYRIPTGRLVCDCCFLPKGGPHTKFCYWNPINKKTDDAAIRASNPKPARRTKP